MWVWAAQLPITVLESDGVIYSTSFWNLFPMVVHLDIFLVSVYNWILLWNILSFPQYQTVSR